MTENKIVRIKRHQESAKIMEKNGIEVYTDGKSYIVSIKGDNIGVQVPYDHVKAMLNW